MHKLRDSDDVFCSHLKDIICYLMEFGDDWQNHSREKHVLVHWHKMRKQSSYPFFIKIISLISVIIQMYFKITKLFQIELELFMYIKNYIFK